LKYLIDTCVVSEITKPYPNRNVLDWIRNIPSDRVFLSVITIGEIRKGVSKLPNSKRKSKLLIWLNTLIEDYSDRILPIDLQVAEIWGETQAFSEKNGCPIPAIDSLIAAIARTHNLILVTRNEDDFKGCNLTTLNPWNITTDNEITKTERK